MNPYLFFDYWYLILVIPAIIFSLIAQATVKGTYSKYSKIASRRGMTGKDAVNYILRQNEIFDIRITQIGGHLTDHFNPKEKYIGLSEEVYNGNSVAALGIAAHEAGHAAQHHLGYGPIRFRNMLLPVANIGSGMAMPLIFIGFIFNFSVLISIGIIFFGAAVLFQFVTLPVEFNASGRALKALEEGHYLDESELSMTKKVLSAAAMTYVAALAVSLAQLLRLILLSRGRNRD